MKKLIAILSVSALAGGVFYYAGNDNPANVARVTINIDTAGVASTQDLTFTMTSNDLTSWGLGRGHVGMPKLDSTDRFSWVFAWNDSLLIWYTKQVDSTQASRKRFADAGWICIFANTWLAQVHEYTKPDSFLSASSQLVIARPLSDTIFKGSITAGDIDGDGRAAITDVTWLVWKLFRGGK